MSSTRPGDRTLQRYNGWPAGINTRVRETEGSPSPDNGMLPPFLRDAENVNFSVAGKPHRRDGFSLLDAAYSHSLWRTPEIPFALFVRDGRLVKLSEELEQTDLGPVDVDAPMSYTAVNHTVYFTNGRDRGTVSARGVRGKWGLPVPEKPQITMAGGGLPAGLYQISLVGVGHDGAYSGASEPVQVHLEEPGGMNVSFVPVWPAEYAEILIFVTQPNSEVLYSTAALYASTPSIDIYASALGRGATLTTANLEPPPAGHIVRHYRGRLYIAIDDIIFFTEPLQYGLVRYDTAFFMQPSRVTMIEPTEDGLFVGQDACVEFLQFTDPYEVQRRVVSSYGVVEGASTRVEGRLLQQAVDYVPVWWAQQGGFAVGLPGGQVQHMTADRLTLHKYGAGAIMQRDHEGLTQLVAALRTPSGNSAGASDSVVAEVRRAT